MADIPEKATLTRRIMIVGGLTLVIAVVGSGIYLSAAGRGDMLAMETSPTFKGGIPPMDAAAPTNLETATFALG